MHGSDHGNSAAVEGQMELDGDREMEERAKGDTEEVEEVEDGGDEEVITFGDQVNEALAQIPFIVT